MGEAQVLHQLMQVIQNRRDTPSANSYTCQLFEAGIQKIGRKVIEEAAEVVEAAGEPGEDGRQHTIGEAADVVYHLLVLLAARDASLNDVEHVLADRFGISGLDEKASRQ